MQILQADGNKRLKNTLKPDRSRVGGPQGVEYAVSPRHRNVPQLDFGPRRVCVRFAPTEPNVFTVNSRQNEGEIDDIHGETYPEAFDCIFAAEIQTQ